MVRLWKAWILAKKDLKVLRTRRALLVMTFFIPIALGVAFPALVTVLIHRKGFSVAGDAQYLSAFGVWFALLSAGLSLYISSYSIVGEKLEKSMEPLLATPTTDGEILLGKYLSVLPVIVVAMWIGGSVYMGLSDLLTSGEFGYLFFPNWSFSETLFAEVPIVSFYAIAVSVFVSSKASSVQGAYQTGIVAILPFFVLYFLGLTGIFSESSNLHVAYISIAFLVIGVLMYFVSKATFDRETILTRWK